MPSLKQIKRFTQYILVGLSFFILILSSFVVNSFLRTSPEKNYRPVHAETILSVTPTPILFPPSNP